jgi:hypothetical protein
MWDQVSFQAFGESVKAAFQIESVISHFSNEGKLIFI